MVTASAVPPSQLIAYNNSVIIHYIIRILDVEMRNVRSSWRARSAHLVPPAEYCWVAASSATTLHVYSTIVFVENTERRLNEILIRTFWI